MNDGWIIVRHWERFQHYGNRRPIWIKIYLDLLHDPNWLTLTPSARAVLLGIWLLYASGHRALPLSTAYLSRALQMRVSSQQLEALNHAGFINFTASKPLALTRSREKDVEKEKTTSVRPLATWSYPQGTAETAFDNEQIKYAPKELP